MSDNSNHTPATATERRPRHWGLEASSWALLAAGATLVVAVINFTIVRPATWQLSQLRRQVAQLESRVEDLAGQRDQVAGTNTLLGQLAEQAQRRDEASRSLDDIAELHVRLNRQAGQVQRAQRALDKFAALQNALLENDNRVAHAAKVLVAIEALEHRLTHCQYETLQSHLALDGVDKMRDRLLEAHCQSVIAQDSLDAIDGLHDRLAASGEANRAAVESLDELVDLRDRLDSEGSGVELARQRVEQLIELKDRTLGQTGNLAAATENLELMIDIHDQFQKIASQFGGMRHWITEIVMFEPTFNHAMRTLQPLMELGNLRHMSAGELRQVVRSMNDRRETQRTAAPDATDSPSKATAISAEPAPQPAASNEATAPVAPIVESARAN